MLHLVVSKATAGIEKDNIYIATPRVARNAEKNLRILYVVVVIFIGLYMYIYKVNTYINLLYIHSLVFSLRGQVGRNQNRVMRPVWLWHTASWASCWGSLPLLSPAFRRFHFRRQVAVRPQRRERS